MLKFAVKSVCRSSSPAWLKLHKFRLTVSVVLIWVLVNWFMWDTFIFSSSLSESWSLWMTRNLCQIFETLLKSYIFTEVSASIYIYSSFTIDQSGFTCVCETVHCSWQFHWNYFSPKPCHPNLVVGNVTLRVGAFSHSRWWGRVQFGCRINVTALSYSLFLNALGCLSMCCGGTCCRSASRLHHTCAHTELFHKHHNYWLKTRHDPMRKHFSVKSRYTWIHA